MATNVGYKKKGEEVSSLVSNLNIEIRNGADDAYGDKPDVHNLVVSSVSTKVIRRELEIEQMDWNNLKTFAALNIQPELLRGVYDMQFDTPSKIQKMVLPILLENPPQNMIAQSQSGTGKTAVFVLAMLSRVDTSKNYVQVLCLSPTLELAIQTNEVATQMSQYRKDIQLRLAVSARVVQNQQITEHILIGTPGKIEDWGLKFKVFNMEKISVLVLDEADILITAFRDQCLRIWEKLPTNCQMMFFSATYDQKVMNFAECIVPNPTIIRLRHESLDNIREYYVRCDDLDTKYKAITNIYGSIRIGQAIIFCETRNTANWLWAQMIRDERSVGVLPSQLNVEQRIAILGQFRAGLFKVLITTNVLSRGIDIKQVAIVLNFDMPKNEESNVDCETYLHRIGRTGRFDKTGIVVNLIDSYKSMKMCYDIQNHFGKRMSALNINNMEGLEHIQL